MTTARWAAVGCITASSLALPIGYTQIVPLPASLFFLLLGAAWLFALLRGWNAAASPLLAVFSLAAAYGAWKGFSPLLMLFALTTALSAWDLDHMLQRYNQVKPDAIQPGIIRRHLLRLAAVDGLGMLLGGTALLIQVHFSFILAIILGLVVFIALSQVVLYLRRSGS